MAVTVANLQAILSLNSAQFSKGLARTERRLKQFGAKTQRAGRALSAGVTAPLVLAGAAAGKFASGFSADMTRINTLVGVSAEQVDTWRDSLVKLGPEVGRGPGELAKAMFKVTSAGQQGAAALDIVENAAKASVVGMGDTADIALTVASALNAYGDASLNAQQAVDIMTGTARAGNFAVEALAGTIGRSLGVAAEMGVQFADLGAFIATYTRVGVSAEEATTSFIGIMNALLKPSEKGKKALDKLGLSFDDLRASIRDRGLASTLLDLKKAFEGNQEGLTAVLKDTRALQGVLGVAGEQASNYARIQGEVRDSLGLTGEAFKVASTEAEAAMARLRASMEALAIAVGQKLLPDFVKMSEKLVAFAGIMTKFHAGIIGVTAAAIALGPALLALSFAAKAVGIAFGWLVAGNPIMVSLAGLALIVAGIVIKVREWRDAAREAGEAMRLAREKETRIAATGIGAGVLSGALEGLHMSFKKAKGPAEELQQITEEMGKLQNKVDFADQLGLSDDVTARLRLRIAQLGELKQAVSEGKFAGAGGAFPTSTKAGTGGVDEAALNKQKQAQEEIRDRFQSIADEIITLTKGELPAALIVAEREMRKLADTAAKTDEETEVLVGHFKALHVAASQTQAEESFSGILDDIGRRIAAVDTSPLTAQMNGAIAEVRRLGDQYGTLPERVEQVVTQIKAEYRELEAATEAAGKKVEIALGENVLNSFSGTLDGIRQGTRDFKEVGDQITSALVASFEEAFIEIIRQKTGFDQIVIKNFGDDLPKVFKDFAASAVNTMTGMWDEIVSATLTASKWVWEAIKGIGQALSQLGGSGGGGGGGTVGTILGVVGAVAGFAAEGAVVKASPGGSLMVVGEGGKDEAIIPLDRMDGIGGGGGGVVVNVYAPPGSTADAEETQQGDGGKRIDIIIGQSAAKNVDQGGPLDRSIQTRYGLTPVGR